MGLNVRNPGTVECIMEIWFIETAASVHTIAFTVDASDINFIETINLIDVNSTALYVLDLAYKQ